MTEQIGVREQAVLALMPILVCTATACSQPIEEKEYDEALRIEESLGIPLVNDPGFPYTADDEVRQLTLGEGRLRASPSTIFCSHGSSIGRELQSRGVKWISAGEMSAVWQRLDQVEYLNGAVRTRPVSSSSCDDEANSIHLKTLAFVSPNDDAVLVQMIAWQGEIVRSAYVGLKLDVDDPSTWPPQRPRIGPPTLKASIQQNIDGLSQWFPNQIVSAEKQAK